MKMIKFRKDMNGFVLLRKQLGLTQKQLAARLNVSRALVSMVEKGERSFPLEALVKLSGLEVSMIAKQRGEEPRPCVENYHPLHIQRIKKEAGRDT